MKDKFPHIILGLVVFIIACIIGAISGCGEESRLESTESTEPVVVLLLE